MDARSGLGLDGSRAWKVPLELWWGSGVGLGGHGLSLLQSIYGQDERSTLWRFPQ